MSKARRVTRAWCPVRTNERVADDTYWLELVAPEIAAQAIPGQFVMVGFGPAGYAVPFLPRPNSVAAVRDDQVGLLIRIFGEGSRRLAALRPDELVLLLGPLGTWYELGQARQVVCVAGGVGLAPFIFLPRWVAGSAPGVQLRLLYGERRAAAVFDPARLLELCGRDAEVWTEDGELGRQGQVTEGIQLDGVDLILGCGPTPMLKQLRTLAMGAEIPCQLAVEEHMACGMGTCIGCVIETVDPESGAEGYSRVCVEGPVFSAERLRW